MTYKRKIFLTLFRISVQKLFETFHLFINVAICLTLGRTFPLPVSPFLNGLIFCENTELKILIFYFK